MLRAWCKKCWSRKRYKMKFINKEKDKKAYCVACGSEVYPAPCRKSNLRGTVM